MTNANKCVNCMYAALSNGVGNCMNRANGNKIIMSWGTCDKHIDDDDRATGGENERQS